MKNQQAKIAAIYDKITAITVTQGRLLPASLIYGDGTKFFNDRKLFDTVYNEIRQYIILKLNRRFDPPKINC